MTITRRNLIRGTGIALCYAAYGSKLFLTPAQAFERDLPFTSLTSPEAKTLESICEILLPGATKAGIAHYIDQQVSVEANDSFLILKYFDYEPPYIKFYQSALHHVDSLCESMYQKRVNQLSKNDARSLVESLQQNTNNTYSNLPGPLIYHVLRNDAVDVVYGTYAGFNKLQIPYMEHILPPRPW